MKRVAWLVLGLLGSCSLGEVLLQPQRPEEHIIVTNLVYAPIPNGPTITSAAYQYDEALLTGQPFSLALRFSEILRYFYPDGQGRESPVGSYQVDWKIFAPGGTRNLLVSPSSSTNVVNNFFVALQGNLQARTREDLPKEAILYLKIYTAEGPPYLPAGDYTVKAEVSDGEPGNPQVLHSFLRQLRVVPPLALANGAKLSFRAHLSSREFAMGGEASQQAQVINGQLLYKLSPAADTVQSYVTFWDWQLTNSADLTLSLSRTANSKSGARLVALSKLPSSQPAFLDANTSHPAGDSAVVMRYSQTDSVAEFDLIATDAYLQTARMQLRLQLR